MFSHKKLPWNHPQVFHSTPGAAGLDGVTHLPEASAPQRRRPLGAAHAGAAQRGRARRSRGHALGGGISRWMEKNTWEKHGQNHEMHHLINVSSLFFGGLGSFFFSFWYGLTWSSGVRWCFGFACWMINILFLLNDRNLRRNSVSEDGCQRAFRLNLDHLLSTP